MRTRQLSRRLSLMAAVTSPLLTFAMAVHAQSQTNVQPAPKPAKAIKARKSAAGDPAGQSEALIVTGTRETHKTVRQSASPIDVVTSANIVRTGQTSVIDALAQLLPSVTKPAEGALSGSPTDYLSLRGLNPNQTLVLVNGKRFHTTSNIYIGGFADGSTPVDVDLIPPGLIDHVEVLRDGAAAQYGSDAIAGVVNIILKSGVHDGSVNSQIGQYDAGDGFTASANVQQGVALGSRGFLDLSAGYRHQDHTDRDTTDDRTGTHVDEILGDPDVTRYEVGFNTGYNLTDNIQLYSSGTYAYRYTNVYELYRLPSALNAIYPGGFSPQQKTNEDDFSAALGLKGSDLFGWNWDLSSTYGGDFIDMSIINSANEAEYAETGFTPKAFHLSNTASTLLTNNFDINRTFHVPYLPYPVTLAGGLEHRFETFSTGVGAVGSYELGGSQAVAGLLPSNAGTHSRVVYSAYVDASTHITRPWLVDLAGRFEDYTDFGRTYNGKITSRYDFTKRIALRGTISSGTRAPSLADEYYSELGIGPDYATGTLAANSAGARLLGAAPLKPERSYSMTAGLVLEPINSMNVAVDLYQIDIRDRIVTGQAVAGEDALEALKVQGITPASTLLPEDVSASYFTNGASTRTRGVDVTVDYLTDFGRWGKVTWDFAANANYQRITHTNTNALGDSDLSTQNIAYLTTSTPKSKIVLGGFWRLGRWDLALHELRYGETIDDLTYDAGPNAYSTTVFYRQYNGPRYITNLQIGFRPIPRLRVAVGANNLFNQYPSRIPSDAGFYSAEVYDLSASQTGIDGGFYYMQASCSF